MEKRVLIAIPAFNEAKNIEQVLSSVTNYKDNVVVINDGSVDDTLQLIKKMGVNVVSHKKNQGLSAVYRTLFDYAGKHGYSHMATFDADGQHETSSLPKFIDLLNDFDFVAGNRFHSLNEIPDCKLASNFFATLLTQITFGVTMPDISCGFRAMKFNGSFNNLQSSHFGVIYEMLFRQINNNKNIGIINIPAKYDLSVPLTTKTREIIDLIAEVMKHNPLPGLKQIIDDISFGHDFGIELLGHDFNGTYIDHSNYRFSTDITKAKMFYKDNFISKY
ncbi:MAG: hypothetical protein B6D64_01025 [Bacteroidetes bacterium 4484_276]|nr:MAG: hypothetical protein B6D64_01025 [Bacteroidetes bacterium 4484_276]